MGPEYAANDSNKLDKEVWYKDADFLLSGDQVQIKDRELFKKFEVTQDIDEETKAVVDNFLDLIIRDFRARKAYAG